MKAGLEDIVGMKGKQTIRERYRRFDNKYIRPHIIRDGQGKEPKIMETFSKLKMKDAKDFIKRNQSLTLGRLSFTDPSTQAYKEFIDKRWPGRNKIVTKYIVHVLFERTKY